jgi:hypothetical protein
MPLRHVGEISAAAVEIFGFDLAQYFLVLAHELAVLDVVDHQHHVLTAADELTSFDHLQTGPSAEAWVEVGAEGMGKASQVQCGKSEKKKKHAYSGDGSRLTANNKEEQFTATLHHGLQQQQLVGAAEARHLRVEVTDVGFGQQWDGHVVAPGGWVAHAA